MDDELNQGSTGQAPSPAPVATVQDTATQTDSTTDELRRARDEAAKRRVELKQMREQLAQLQPLAEEAERMKQAQMSEQEKLAKQLQSVQAQLESKKARAVKAEREGRFTTLAAKASIPADLMPFLNVAAFEVDDEAVAAEQLAKVAALFKGGAQVSPTNPTNPARGSSQRGTDDLRAFLFGSKSGIFGGQ